MVRQIYPILGRKGSRRRKITNIFIYLMISIVVLSILSYVVRRKFFKGEAPQPQSQSQPQPSPSKEALFTGSGFMEVVDTGAESSLSK